MKSTLFEVFKNELNKFKPNMIDIIKKALSEKTDSRYFDYNYNSYLTIQKEGFAAQYTFPFAKKLCIGDGLDVGCNRKEWALPDSVPVDIDFNNGYHANNLPSNINRKDLKWDYIMSSHTLEHIADWVAALDLWWDSIREGGVIYLYLPDYSQEYWRVWNNRKHVNNLRPNEIRDYFNHKGASKVFVGNVDLYNSFTVVAFK
jgi:SAM-dependent methyltransferase